jgi:SAM-dependent methyltransferase
MNGTDCAVADRIFSLSWDESAGIEFNRGGEADRLLLDRPVAVEASEDFYAEFYQGGAAHALADLRRSQLPQLAALAGLDVARRESSHLDVGCGAGIAVRYVNEQCPNVRSYGIEPGLPADQPPLFRASLDDLDRVRGLPPAFDVISFLDVLEHFPDPRPVLQQARRRLAPDGLLLIKVPTRSALIYQAAKHLRHVTPAVSRTVLRRLYQLDYRPPHYLYFDLPSLTMALENAGFVVERHAYVSEIPLAHLWRRLWGMPLPARIAAFACLLPLKALPTPSLRECLAVVARPQAASADTAA